jgi:uncharacterized OB-fold protein
METAIFMNKQYNMHLDFSLALGESFTKWMQALKDKKILGNTCPKCERIFVPAKPFCEICFEELKDWVETDGTGVVESFTVTYQKFRNCPEPPYAVGIIRIGKAATCMTHWIGGLDYKHPDEIPGKIKIGMKVEPVWKEERVGDPLDILYFKPVA